MRIVTMCGCGLGTCLLLKMTAESAFSELGVDAEVIHSDIGSAMSIDCDLYVVTSDLAEKLEEAGKPYVAVQNVNSTEEMKRKLADYLNHQPI